MVASKGYTPIGMVWISVVSMIVGVIAALLTVGVFSGRLDARVTALESIAGQSMPRGEWSQFEKDVRERLDRIENKLDAHMGGK